MRANEPYVDDAIWVVDPHHDAILVASDIEYRAAVLEDAGRANVAFDVRRRRPLGRFDLPVPRHHGIARFGIRGTPVAEGLERTESDHACRMCSTRGRLATSSHAGVADHSEVSRVDANSVDW